MLQESIAHLLKRPAGRPPKDVRRYHASFGYQAGTRGKPRRVVAKVEWHPGELYPRVGLIVTNLGRPAERVVAFYNQRGTAEQWIEEGKFMRILALPDAVEQRSLTSLREKLIKIGAKIVRHGRYVTFQIASQLVHEMIEARDEKRLLRLQDQLARVSLLIVDEFGYVPLSQTGSELLFDVFSRRYENGATIVTSNLPFQEWTSVFASERLTGALLDRITHHVHILEMNGESYRLKQSRSRRQPPSE